MIARPYKGLASFEDSELDARLFFGRDAERDTLIANLQASRLTVLYGASGVGKSSLLRAGVAQKLRADGSSVVVVHSTWIENPVDALIESIRAAAPPLGPTAGLADTVAAAVAAGGEVVLLLDQLEEYFMYHGGDGPLLDGLHELLRRPGLRISVLLSVRDDALAQFDAFSGRLPETFANMLRLQPIGARAAGDAILKPLDTFAEITGERVNAERSLVDILKSEVDGGLSAPFLQLILEGIWDEERRAGSAQLTERTLVQLGGTQAIAAAHVSETLNSLPDDLRYLTARIIRQLVTPSGAKVALSEADLAEYAGVSRGRVAPLLERLGRERVLRAVDEIGDRGAVYQIFHDVLAQPLLEWRQQIDVARARSGARRVAAGALAALVVVSAIAVYALVQRSSANAQARRSHGHALAAEALAAVPTNPAASLTLALRAAKTSGDDEVAAVLRSGLLAMRENRVLHLGGTTTVLIRGERLLAASSDGVLTIDDLRGYPLVRMPRQAGLGPVAWTADGELLATGARSGRATIWNATTGKTMRITQLPAPIATLQFVGHVLLIGGGGHIRLVYGAHGTTRTLRVGGAVSVAALAPDKRVVAVAWKRAGHVTTQLVNVRTRRVIRTLPEKGVEVVAFAPRGSRLATGSTDKTARLWTAKGRLVHVLPQRGHILGLVFSHDAKTLISTSEDGTAAVWDVTTGVRELLLTGATGAANAAAMSPDGTEYAVAFADRDARIYNSIDGRLLAALAGHSDSVTTVAFDAAGRVIATGGDDGTIRLWSATPSDRLRPSRRVIAATPPARATSSDGSIAVTRKGRDAFIRDVKTGRLVHMLQGHRSVVTDGEFSPNGLLVVTSSLDHDARIWDVRTGRLLHVLRGHFFPVYSASFSPDGQWIVTASQFSAGLWNARTGELVEYLRGATSPLANATFVGGNATINARDNQGNGWQATCVVCQPIAGLEQSARARLRALR